jgi:hypothetical protein
MSVANSKNGFERVVSSSVLVVLALLLGLFSCGREQSSEPTGGETHFLTRCTPGTASCGSGLSCVCGVCTLGCEARAACQGLPDAACVSSASTASCSESDPMGHCDVACINDDDCAVLSASHRCESGACRAGEPASSACTHGDTAANQVLLIGDSFFASSHQVTAYLEDAARSASALTAGERYRDNSRLIDNALALAGTGIANQYQDGVAESDVQVVIMNGGGADVLLGSCDTVDASCPVIADAAAAARDLLAQMATDGVRQVIYVSYPDPTDASVRAKMDALRPLLQDACDGAAVPCHWLDLRSAFAGRYAELILPDGLNPTASGSQVTARAIWDVMQQYCVAQ